MVARPRSSACGFISRILTGRPAFRKFIAMPPPMVPAPSTATAPRSRRGGWGGGGGGERGGGGGGRLGGLHQLHENRALDLHAIGKRAPGGGLDRVHAQRRRREIP